MRRTMLLIPTLFACGGDVVGGQYLRGTGYPVREMDSRAP